MALESVTVFSGGYTFAASNYRVYVPKDSLQATFIPFNLHGLFRGTLQPALAANSLVARAALETVEGRLAFMQAVASIVTNTAFETGLVESLQRRGSQLEPHAGGTAPARRLKWRTAEFQRSLRQRFGAVRAELERTGPLDVQSMASVKPSVITLHGLRQPGSLAIRSDGTLKRQFLDLAQGTNELRPTSPLRVRTMDIQAPQGTLEALTSTTTNWVRVSVLADGRTSLTNVGLRLAGHATRKDFLAKSSFTLKFNWRDKGGKLGTYSKLHFHNALYNPSFLNEFTLSWLSARAGLPAPEVGFAQVAVNGRPLGVFVTVEGVTKSFLKKHFNSADGILLEGEHGDIDTRMDIDNGTLAEGYSDLAPLAAAARRSVDTASWSPLQTYFPLEHAALFTAVEVVAGHWDGYAVSAHNYRIYQPDLNGPFFLIPHGFDALALHREADVCPRGKGILAQALLGAPESRLAYFNALSGVLNPVLDLSAYATDAAAATRWLQQALQQTEPFLAASQIASAATLVDTLAARKTRLWDRLQVQLRQPLETATPVSSAPGKTNRSPL